MDKTPKYMRMCEEAPKELWDKVEHYGSLIAWRSFIGIVMPDPDNTKWEGLASVIPETLVLRTWLKEGKESIVVLETNIDYGGSNGDKGTPLYRQDQLQGIMDYDNIYILASDFGDFVWEEPMPSHYIPRKPEVTSMEQLWLCFVMLEKYLKKWSEGELKWTHS